MAEISFLYGEHEGGHNWSRVIILRNKLIGAAELKTLFVLTNASKSSGVAVTTESKVLVWAEANLWLKCVDLTDAFWTRTRTRRHNMATNHVTLRIIVPF